MNVIIYLATIISIKLRISFIKDQKINNQRKIKKDIVEPLSYDKILIEKDSLLSNLKLMLLEWLGSPYFILHFCRIGIMLIITTYESFFSTILLSWYFIYLNQAFRFIPDQTSQYS